MQNIYSIRDNKTSHFMRPIADTAEVNVKRDFALVVNNMTDSQIYHYPEDYDLYQLGEFDEQSGTISGFTAPVFICSAVSLKKQKGLNMSADDIVNMPNPIDKKFGPLTSNENLEDS